MRFAILTVSAIAISGCSWMGGGSGSHAGHGAQGYGATTCGGAVGGGSYGYGGGSYGQGGYGGGCGGAAYGAQTAGYAGQGFGAPTYGAQGYGGQAGAGAYAGSVAYQGTTLGAGAPYGQAMSGAGAYASSGAYGLRGGQSFAQSGAVASAGGQFGGGQFIQGGMAQRSGVQTVVGAPIYVPQPYPAPYGVPRCSGMPCGGGGSFGGGGAMPWGFEVNAGTDFDIGGDVFTAKPAGTALGNAAVNTGGSDGISYDAAFGQTQSIGGSLAYDVSRSTTLLGSVGYSQADGNKVDGYQSVDARNPGTLEDIDAQFSDLNLWTIEGGVRQYVGQNYGFRPYVGASAGFTHNNNVDIQRTYSVDDAAYDAAPFRYIESGWKPTAAAVLGAEMAVGKRAAIGVESGIRWRDNMNTAATSEDRFSIPVKLRGRIAF